MNQKSATETEVTDYTEIIEGDLADLIGHTRIELARMEEAIKAVEIPEGESNIEFVGDHFRALVGSRETLKITEVGKANFYKTVGHLKAKTYIEKQEKITYKVKTAAVKDLLAHPQGDADLQEGKRIIKANSNVVIDATLKVEPIKKD